MNSRKLNLLIVFMIVGSMLLTACGAETPTPTPPAAAPPTDTPAAAPAATDTPATSEAPTATQAAGGAGTYNGMTVDQIAAVKSELAV